MAEYFRDAEGQDVLLFVDNIFRFTQVGISLFPPDPFPPDKHNWEHTQISMRLVRGDGVLGPIILFRIWRNIMPVRLRSSEQEPKN